MTYLAASHHTSHGLLNTLVHGFAWRTGNDAADTIFRLAPGLVTVAVVAVLIVLCARWLRRR